MRVRNTSRKSYPGWWPADERYLSLSRARHGPRYPAPVVAPMAGRDSTDLLTLRESDLRLDTKELVAVTMTIAA